MAGMKPGMTKEGPRQLPPADPIHFRELLGAELPLHRLDVLPDLLRRGGAGDHAGDLRAGGEPGEGELDQRMSARLGENLELLDQREVGVAAVALAHAGRTG